MPNSVSRISTGPVVQLDNNIPDPTIRNSIISPNAVEVRHNRMWRCHYWLLNNCNNFQGIQIKTSQSNPPTIDLQGHTVEELAAAANVSVEVIKSAIKLREEEMLKEKLTQELDQATFIQQQILAAQQQTSVATLPTTQFIPLPSTTPVPSYKAKKHTIIGGHKVSINCAYQQFPLTETHYHCTVSGDECSQRILSSRLW